MDLEKEWEQQEEEPCWAEEEQREENNWPFKDRKVDFWIFLFLDKENFDYIACIDHIHCLFSYHR